MSDIQDEAYSEAMDEIDKLEQLNDRLIQRMISGNPLMIPKEEMDRLKALIGRAAQRIDDIRYADREDGDEELIAELRKAAE